MYYFLMIFAGGMIGLVVAGPGGSIMGAISGFAIAACEELTGDEVYGANCYSYESPDPDDSDCHTSQTKSRCCRWMMISPTLALTLGWTLALR